MTIHVFHAIHRLLKDIQGNDVLFGGKVGVFGGDYRQTLPVVKRGTVTAILENCILRSPLWPHVHTFHLTDNMRLNPNQRTFQHFLLQIGEGRVPTRNAHPFEECIQLPSDIVLQNNIIDFVFPFTSLTTFDDLKNHAILCPTNKVTYTVNLDILNRVPGQSKTYYGIDSIVNDSSITAEEEEAYPVEFLNTISATGLPSQKLTLKVGAPVILLRNLDSSRGLTNGTRLLVKVLHHNISMLKLSLVRT